MIHINLPLNLSGYDKIADTINSVNSTHDHLVSVYTKKFILEVCTCNALAFKNLCKAYANALHLHQ